MKPVVVFNDGKGMRGKRAKLIKRGNKRVLIEFITWDFNKEEDITITEWFTLFIPSWADDKKKYQYGKYKSYVHWDTNMFYADYQQQDVYKLSCKEAFTEEYYNSIYGEITYNEN